MSLIDNPLPSVCQKQTLDIRKHLYRDVALEALNQSQIKFLLGGLHGHNVSFSQFRLIQAKVSEGIEGSNDLVATNSYVKKG